MAMRNLKIRQTITNRDEQSVEKYLNEITKIDMITPEEEVVLAIKIGQGDQKALDKLVQANLRFVVTVAKQYQHQGLSLPDLINEGNLGLIKAAQRFDETKGFKFISFAVWWIRQSILQGLAEQARIVRLPQNKIGEYNRTNKAYAAFEQEHERDPSPEELAEILETDASKIADLLHSKIYHTSLDAPVHDGDDGTAADMLEDTHSAPTDHQLDVDSLGQEVRKLVLRLDSRKAGIVKAFFGIDEEHPVSLEDIGERYGLTRERVRQIKDKAVKQLQKESCKAPLRKYLG